MVIVMDEVSRIAQVSEMTFRHGKWTKEEDELLRTAVQNIGERKWRQVSTLVPGRTSIQCLHRWTKVLKPGRVKGSWTPEEDQLLRDWVQTEGPNKWSQCALKIAGRSGKQCRERWMNSLSPEVRRGDWEPAEDEILLHEFERLGARWTEIAKALPGRTDNAIKNRFYSNIRKIRPKSLFPPAEGSSFYYDDTTDPARIEAEMQVFNLLKYMQKLETMLSNTKEQIVVLETTIDDEFGKKATLV